MSISENIELSYDLFDIEIPRTASINFYQRIIEDLTGYDVLSIVYNQDQECIIAVYKPIPAKINNQCCWRQLAGLYPRCYKTDPIMD